MKCHCKDCSPDPLQTYSEQFKHESEVRYVSKQNGAWIKEFLEGVEKKRGFDARDRLRKDVLIEWNKRK